MPSSPSPKLDSAAVLLAIAASAPLLHGCAPAAVIGAAYGASVIHERRPASTVLDDEVIELKAKHLYFQTPEVEQASRIAVTSYNHRVLLTGQADSAEPKDEFARIVSRIPKVTQVYNEVRIGPRISLSQESEDALITSRAKIAIGGGKGVEGFDATRVKIVTEDGVVYLMGLVTTTEAETTTDTVRRLPGVTRVVRMFEYITPDAADQGTTQNTDGTG